MNSAANPGASALSKLAISLHLAKNEKEAQRVLLMVGFVGIVIAISIFFSLSHSSPTGVPKVQLQQTIINMKEISAPIRQRP